ncbi:hypothetical protein [Herpetosiphon geysericola]|uniref:Uncharacterized protein n=1 Tax=Herpetosiphon geysericola TaxID=70996 RepID=A0A0P6YKK1_9CHLR|nr:hypothetical protein [Herpetosiphon geysericola]KPL83029.1 hypothetical protein SE18_19495 [Herpetosiphon geysericola]
MTTTPKSIRVGERSMQVLDALRVQLADQYSSDSALLTEAARRGLLVMAVEAWHAEAGQYGGHQPKELARLLRYELNALFNFLLEQDELPPMLRIVAAPTPPAVVPIMVATEPVVQPEPTVTTVEIDTTVMDLMELAGQDEEWD